MNIPVLVVAVIMAVALVGHISIGTKETAALEPRGASGKPMANWVQTMSAFQMLSVDLALLVGLLLTLGIWDVIPNERVFVLGLAAYFAVQGALWLGHILWLKREGATLRSLPHWAVWFLCAGLLLLGA